MDWSNERYVRNYTRDTTTWKLMDWRGRCVLQLLLRKVDRAGVLDVGDDGVLGLAAVIEMPIEIVEVGIRQLTTFRGKGLPTVIYTGTAFVIPNFMDAQEAPQSDAQRKRESRSLRRDKALAESRNLLPASGSGTACHETGRERDGNGEAVTPILAFPLPSLAVESSLPGARAIPPSTERAPVSSVPADGGQTGRGADTTVQVSRPAAGNVADPQLDPRGQRIEHPPSAGLPPTREPRSSWHDRKRWWDAMLAADARLRADGIAVDRQTLPPAPAGIHETNLAACARQLADAGFDAAEVDRRVLHVIAVAEAEARRSEAKWFKPALIFEPERFARAVDTTLAEAARPRDRVTAAARPLETRPAGRPARPEFPAPAPRTSLSVAERLALAAEANAIVSSPEALAALAARDRTRHRKRPASQPPTTNFTDEEHYHDANHDATDEA
jgi:hypothetical protein